MTNGQRSPDAERPPGGRAATHDTRLTAVQFGVEISRDPRVLVQTADLADLLEAWHAAFPALTACSIDDETYIVCPKCRRGRPRDGGGTCRVHGPWTMRCWMCKSTFTRAMFEHEVLCDSDLLSRLKELVADRSVDGH